MYKLVNNLIEYPELLCMISFKVPKINLKNVNLFYSSLPNIQLELKFSFGIKCTN